MSKRRATVEPGAKVKIRGCGVFDLAVEIEPARVVELVRGRGSKPLTNAEVAVALGVARQSVVRWTSEQPDTTKAPGYLAPTLAIIAGRTVELA
jgi:hypothetical protein